MLVGLLKIKRYIIELSELHLFIQNITRFRRKTTILLFKKLKKKKKNSSTNFTLIFYT